MNSNFEMPPKKLAFLTYLGGVVTAVAAIAGLEMLSGSLSQKESTQESGPTTTATAPSSKTSDPAKAKPKAKNVKPDSRSIKFPGDRVSQQEIAKTTTPYVPAHVGKLSPAELKVAKKAWSYFETNINPETGLANSVDQFQSVTLWDQSAAMAALVSAKELDLVSEKEFKETMSKMLTTLAKLELYKGELPNKVYNSQNLMPVNYGSLDKREEIGWSAIDLGRIALWLKIIAAKYPEFEPQTTAVWKAWDVKRLTKDGQMYGTSIKEGQEQYNQEGRLGYEDYAAYGLKLWGLNVDKALDYENKSAFVELYGHSIPFDVRDRENSEANNYVLSEPFFLDGIETGFKALPKAYADRMLAAQEARYKATKQLTAITEDNLDREPYFVYNTLYVNGKPWATISDTGENYNHLRFVSTKAAIGWHVLYNTDYTKKLFAFVQEKVGSKKGWYSGFYETLDEPNAVLTANNNGIILECLLFKKVGKPLAVWAGVSELGT